MKSYCALAVFALLASAAVPEGFAIINGQIEPDYPAVGFLADGVGNSGSGVLIDPYWVLTSAAFATVCTDGVFYMGLDHTAADATYAVSGIYPHMNYDPEYGDHNIALLRLATPVVGVEPVPCLTSPSALLSGSSVTYVGYGWTSLSDGSNTIRHSCLNSVEILQAMTFVTVDGNAGPYLGDSGGPALLEVGGVPYVAGLVSYVAAGGLEYTVSTRVSSYIAFIEAVMAANPPLSGVADQLPAVRRLQVTPNPCNPSTEISFELDEPAACRVTVFDAHGRRVTNLADRRFDAGRNAVRWYGRSADGRGLPSGVYFVLLQMDGRAETRKIVLAR